MAAAIKLAISIVTHNSAEVIAEALASVESALPELDSCRVVVVDNDSHDGTADIVASCFPWVTLIRSDNVGYGAGHNLAIRQWAEETEYHLVLNPDIRFESGVLKQMLAFMDQHSDIGLTMPQIRWPDGRIQFLCKRLPAPFDLLVRRFLPAFMQLFWKQRIARYEMRDNDYMKTMDVPYLSGCFMLLRSAVFRTVGLFDERFFLYMEDVDLSRRIHCQWRTVYYPEVFVWHQYRHASYRYGRHLCLHVASALKYFHKWGWFFDHERRRINDRI